MVNAVGHEIHHTGCCVEDRLSQGTQRVSLRRGLHDVRTRIVLGDRELHELCNLLLVHLGCRTQEITGRLDTDAFHREIKVVRPLILVARE